MTKEAVDMGGQGFDDPLTIGDFSNPVAKGPFAEPGWEDCYFMGVFIVQFDTGTGAFRFAEGLAKPEIGARGKDDKDGNPNDPDRAQKQIWKLPLAASGSALKPGPAFATVVARIKTNAGDENVQWSQAITLRA